MQERKQSLDFFLTDLLGTEYSNSPNKVQILDTLHNDPAALETAIYTADPSMYEAEQQAPGTMKNMVSNYVNVSYWDIAKAAIPGAMASVADAALGVAAVADPSVQQSQAYRDVKAWQDFNALPINPEDLGKKAVSGGLTSAAQMGGIMGAAALGVAAVGASPALIPTLAIGGLSAVSGGSAAGEHIAEGGSQLGAATKGAAYAVFEFAANKIIGPVEAAMNLGLGKNVIKEFASYTVKEVTEELVTETGQAATDYFAETGSKQPFLERLRDTALATIVAAPILGGGMSVANPRIQAAQVVYDTAQDEIARNRTQVTLDKLKASGDAVLIETPDVATDNRETLQHDTGSHNPENVTEFASSDEAYAQTAQTVTPEGNEVINKSGHRMYRVGENVFLKGIKTSIKNSKVVTNNQGVPAVVTEISEDGLTATVEFADKVKDDDGNLVAQTQEVETSTIFPDKHASRKTVHLKVDPTAPNFGSLLRVAKKFLPEVQSWAKVAGKQKASIFAVTAIDNVTGKPYQIKLDKALQAGDPNFAAVTIAHELGHILSMMKSTIPSAEIGGPKSNSLIRKLTRSYSSLKDYILKEPPELSSNPVMQTLISEQQKFVDDRLALKRASDPEARIGTEDHEDMSEKWDSLLATRGIEGLSDKEKEGVTIDVELDVAAGMKTFRKDKGIKRQKSKRLKDERIRLRAEAKKKHMVLAYEKKGMYYLPALRGELEAVSAAMRGLEIGSPLAKAAMMEDRHHNEEMFADFFSAKLLGVSVTLTNGSVVNAAQTFAPTLSAQFDAYQDRNPEFQKIMLEAIEEDNDFEARMRAVIRSQRDMAVKKAAAAEAKNPSKIPLKKVMEGLFLGARKGFMDNNAYAYTAIEAVHDKATAADFRNTMGNLAYITSGVQNFVQDVSAIFDEAFQAIQNEDPSLDMEGTLSYYMMLKRIATGGRVKHYTTTIVNKAGEKIKVRQKYNLLNPPKLPYSPEEAQELLDNTPSLLRHKTALDAADAAFQKVWRNKILKALVSSEIISQGQSDFFTNEMGSYATFQIFQEQAFQGSFDRITPGLQVAEGSLQDFQNVVGSTTDKGISLLWLADINKSKKFLVEHLSGDMKQEAPFQNKSFSKPADKNLRLVTYKMLDADTNEIVDKGYWIDADIASGLEYGSNRADAGLMAFLSESQSYYRQIFTTLNPAFLPRNIFKDGWRLWQNSYNPDPDAISLGGGIMGHFAKAWWQQLNPYITEQDQAVLDKELRDMFEERQVISDYDFKARDASEVSTWDQTTKVYLLSKREGAASQGLRLGAMAKFVKDHIAGNAVGKFIGDSPVGKFASAAFGKYSSVMESASRASERVPKRAARRYYKPFFDKDIISRAEFNQLVRTAGSPNFLNHGAWHQTTGPMLMFFNPSVQGLQEDLEMMKKSKAVLAKRILGTSATLAVTSTLPVLFLRAIGMGDDEFKEKHPVLYNVALAMRAIPHRDMENNICVPIAFTPDGGVVYFRFPLDETTASFRRVLMRLVQLRPSKFADWLSVPGAAIEQVVPKLNPVIKLIIDMTDFAVGRNPSSGFLENTGVIGKAEWEANGSDKLIGMLKHIYNSAAPTSTIIRMKTWTSDAKIKMTPENKLQHIASYIQTVAGIPGAETMLKMGFIKVSGQGYVDEANLGGKTHDEYKASLALLSRALVNAGVEGQPKEFASVLEAFRVGARPRNQAEAMVYAKAYNALGNKLRKAIFQRGFSAELSVYFKLSADQRMVLQDVKN